MLTRTLCMESLHSKVKKKCTKNGSYFSGKNSGLNNYYGTLDPLNDSETSFQDNYTR